MGISLIIGTTLLLSTPILAQETRTIQIVDPNTGASYLTVGSASEPIPPGGIPFSVQLYLNGSTSNLAAWQIDVTFDNNTLRCVGGIAPENDSSYAFYGKPEVTAVDLDHQNFNPPEVAAGAAIINLNQSATVNKASLCILNFEALKVGSTTIEILLTNPSGASGAATTFLLDSKTNDISFNAGGGFTVTVLGNASPPVAAFSYSPLSPKVNDSITFDASSSSSPDGKSIVNYAWNFGDNNTATSATNARAVHAYSRRGFYNVNLTVMDNASSYGSFIKQIQVGIPPSAAFTVSPANPWPGANVLFNASESNASESGVAIVSYVWVFDDVFPANTTTTTAAEITHTFHSAGNFTVTLSVYDSDGFRDVYSVYLSVNPQSPLAFLTSPFFMLLAVIIVIFAIAAIIFYLRRHRKSMLAQKTHRKVRARAISGYKSFQTKQAFPYS
jgi:PKD repeat protein